MGFTFHSHKTNIINASQAENSHYVNSLLHKIIYITLPCIVQNNVPCTSGLAQSIGAGTKDLFYEPYMGIVQGPGEFAEGVVIGLL